MKVVQYEAIPIVKDMECPNCHNSDIGGFPPHERAKPIGGVRHQRDLWESLSVPNVLKNSDVISVLVAGESVETYHYCNKFERANEND